MVLLLQQQTLPIIIFLQEEQPKIIIKVFQTMETLLLLLFRLLNLRQCREILCIVCNNKMDSLICLFQETQLTV